MFGVGKDEWVKLGSVEIGVRVKFDGVGGGGMSESFVGNCIFVSFIFYFIDCFLCLF